MIVPLRTAITCRRVGSEWRVLPPWRVVTSPAPRRTGSRTGRSARGAAALLRYSSSLQLSDTYIREFKTQKSALVGDQRRWNSRFFAQLVEFYTAKKQYRNKYSQKGIARPQSNFHIHVSVSDLYIPTTDLPILLKENMWTDPGNI